MVTYPSGQWRGVKDPTPASWGRAFEELGTDTAVAGAFGVSRRVVSRWLSLYGMDPASRPEVLITKTFRKRMSNREDRVKVAQWLMDEGGEQQDQERA